MGGVGKRADALVTLRDNDSLSEFSMDWASATAEAFSGASPLRTFKWYDGQEHYSGTYWSATNRDHVIYVVDFSDAPSAAECREQIEQTRNEARRRYPDYLTTVFDLHSATDPGMLADVALDALTLWRHVDGCEGCECSCHPRIPKSDFHDYGFSCVCTRTPEDRRRALDKLREDRDTFWK